ARCAASTNHRFAEVARRRRGLTHSLATRWRYDAVLWFTLAPVMDERGSSHGTGTSTAHGIVGALQLLQSFPQHRSGACAGCGCRPVAGAEAAPPGLAGTQQALAPLAAQALLSAVATGWR